MEQIWKKIIYTIHTKDNNHRGLLNFKVKKQKIQKDSLN